MRKITHSKKTSLVLHIEDYTNAGLKQEDVIKNLDKIDGVWRVTKYPINSNVQIHISGHSPDYIDDILLDVEVVLESMVFELELAEN